MTDEALTGVLVPTADELEQQLPGDLMSPLAVLRATALNLDLLVDLHPEDIEGLARTLELIDIIRRDLATVQDKVKTFMNENAPSYQFTVDGVGTYMKANAGNKDKWDTDGVLAELVQRLVGETGESPGPWEVVEAINEVFNLPNPRTTVLKQKGIAIDDYRERIPGRPSIKRVSETKR